MEIQEIKTTDINENTIIVCIDESGGLCDRICKGSRGLIANANASIECWNFNSIDETDKLELITGDTQEDLENAIEILNNDNYTLLFVTHTRPIITDSLIIGYNLLTYKPSSDITVLDMNKIKFNENNMYSIY